MQKYFLGVDGGNTKTDYLLCTVEGEFVDVIRTPTCSHEHFGDGYESMERLMREQLAPLFERNKIDVTHVQAAGFGLAGADLPQQYVELKKRVAAIGFTQYGLANDGILGIKGASDSGVGLCAVNGTGTVVLGINEKGDVYQVGGVGSMSGDAAGGGFLCNKIVTRLYEYYNCCGPYSSMIPELLELLEADPDDMLSTVTRYKDISSMTKEIIQIGAKAAVGGDPVAMAIFDGVGESIARCAAGCINRLGFEKYGTLDLPIDIVLVGSIWHKVPYEGMKASFLNTTQELSGKICRLIKMDAPAAVGGVLWAKEIADSAPVPPAYRKSILDAISIKKYEELCQSKPWDSVPNPANF